MSEPAAQHSRVARLNAALIYAAISIAIIFVNKHLLTTLR